MPVRSSPGRTAKLRQERGAPSEGCPRGGTGSWGFTPSPGTRPCFYSLSLFPQCICELHHAQLSWQGQGGHGAGTAVGLWGAAQKRRGSLNERPSGEKGCPGFVSTQFQCFSLLMPRPVTEPVFSHLPPPWSLSVLQTHRAHYRQAATYISIPLPPLLMLALLTIPYLSPFSFPFSPLPPLFFSQCPYVSTHMAIISCDSV